MKDGTETQRANLRKLLREIREKSRIRQVDLAKKLGKQQSYVSKYESGEKTLDFLEVREVCFALGVSFEKFIKQYEEKQ